LEAATGSNDMGMLVTTPLLDSQQAVPKITVEIAEIFSW